MFKKIQQNEHSEIGIMIILSIFINFFISRIIPLIIYKGSGNMIQIPITFYELPLIYVGWKYGWKKGGFAGLLIYSSLYLLNLQDNMFKIRLYGNSILISDIIFLSIFLLWGVTPSLPKKSFHLSTLCSGVIVLIATTVIFISVYGSTLTNSFVSGLFFSGVMFVPSLIVFVKMTIKKKLNNKRVKEINVIEKDEEFYIKLDSKTLKTLLNRPEKKD